MGWEHCSVAKRREKTRTVILDAYAHIKRSDVTINAEEMKTRQQTRIGEERM